MIPDKNCSKFDIFAYNNNLTRAPTIAKALNPTTALNGCQIFIIKLRRSFGSHSAPGNWVTPSVCPSVCLSVRPSAFARVFARVFASCNWSSSDLSDCNSKTCGKKLIIARLSPTRRCENKFLCSPRSFCLEFIIKRNRITLLWLAFL